MFSLAVNFTVSLSSLYNHRIVRNAVCLHYTVTLQLFCYFEVTKLYVSFQEKEKPLSKWLGVWYKQWGKYTELWIRDVVQRETLSALLSLAQAFLWPPVILARQPHQTGVNSKLLLPGLEAGFVSWLETTWRGCSVSESELVYQNRTAFASLESIVYCRHY